MKESYSDFINRKVDYYLKQGYLCCSKNCTNGVVKLVPRSCIDNQVSYSGRLFCADIIKPFVQESFL